MSGGVDADVADPVRGDPERGCVQSEEAGAFEVVRDEGDGLWGGNGNGNGGRRGDG